MHLVRRVQTPARMMPMQMLPLCSCCLVPLGVGMVGRSKILYQYGHAPPVAGRFSQKAVQLGRYDALQELENIAFSISQIDTRERKEENHVRSHINESGSDGCGTVG